MADSFIQVFPVAGGASLRLNPKRALDVAFALFLMLLGLPLAFLVAFLVRLTSRGPVLYWQQRVGKDGVLFWFPKFRTMVANAEHLRDSLEPHNHHAGDILFKLRNDPRVTPLGRVLRKSSLDELPQLYCVLRGEMSLVGPRPPLPHEVARYSCRELGRLRVVPGLTCLWQVKGRSELPFQEQVRLDLDYIAQQGLWLDLKILFATIPAVLFGRGAY